MVVFLTGLAPLPPGAAASIYFSLPDPSAPPTWHYLGFLTNEKPSAIYKISNISLAQQREVGANPGALANGQLSFNYTQAPVHHLAQIGISLEPIESVVQMVPAVDTTASNVTSFTEFINKTVGNLFNYCSSFSRSASDLMGNPFQSGNPPTSTQYVPLTTIQTWYENYTRRLSNDQNFWKTLN